MVHGTLSSEILHVIAGLPLLRICHRLYLSKQVTVKVEEFHKYDQDEERTCYSSSRHDSEGDMTEDSNCERKVHREFAANLSQMTSIEPVICYHVAHSEQRVARSEQNSKRWFFTWHKSNCEIELKKGLKKWQDKFVKEMFVRYIKHQGPLLTQDYLKLYAGLGNTSGICLRAVEHSLSYGE